MQIRRCHHVKVNGEQCGSPALRGKCYCYFHNNYRHLGAYGVPQRKQRKGFASGFPVLEDANSIQVGVMQVIRLILAQQIESKEAGLLLYALQIASSNLSRVRVEPWRDDVVIDPLLVRYSPVGGRPAREEQFKIATEEQQKDREEFEEEVAQSQEQADAEWEAETRREFEPSADVEPEGANEEAASSTPPRRQPSAAHQAAMKLFDAGTALVEHPGDPEYIRAYQAAWDAAEEAKQEVCGTATPTS